MVVSSKSTILAATLLATLLCSCTARGVDKYEREASFRSFTIWCDGRRYSIDQFSPAKTISGVISRLTRYCHVTPHIDAFRDYIEDNPKMASVLKVLESTGVWELFTFWRNEVLNRGYSYLYRYLADREAGHVRHGRISSRCVRAENNLDRDIKSSSRRTVINATKRCIQECGRDLAPPNDRSVAERGYYEGCRCAQRGVDRLRS